MSDAVWFTVVFGVCSTFAQAQPPASLVVVD